MPRPQPHKIVEVQDVSFCYQTHPVLERINLTIHEGDYLGVIGPNGGGKTTLLKLMLGLLPVQTGEIRLFGVPVQSFKDWSKVGYVPQRAIQFDTQFPATVKEVVEMGQCVKQGRKRFWTRERSHAVDEALEQVDMRSYKDRLIGELSSGQQQRVFIARALVGQPQVLFLDEPTVGVDVTTQEQFYGLLRTLNQSQGLTLVLISHDIDVVASQASEIACVNCRLVCHCPPKDFDANTYIKDLYGKDIKFIVHDH